MYSKFPSRIEFLEENQIGEKTNPFVQILQTSIWVTGLTSKGLGDWIILLLTARPNHTFINLPLPPPCALPLWIW